MSAGSTPKAEPKERKRWLETLLDRMSAPAAIMRQHRTIRHAHQVLLTALAISWDVGAEVGDGGSDAGRGWRLIVDGGASPGDGGNEVEERRPRATP